VFRYRDTVDYRVERISPDRDLSILIERERKRGKGNGVPLQSFPLRSGRAANRNGNLLAGNRGIAGRQRQKEREREENRSET